MTSICLNCGPEPSGESVILRYRKRAIGSTELEFLQRMIADHADKGRTHLSRVICEAWQWRQPNGELSLAGCRDLLNMLQRAGHLDLPARRAPRYRGKSSRLPIPSELIPLAWSPLGPEHIDLDDVEVRPVVADEAQGWRLFVDRYHYLGAGRMVGEQLRYVATAGGEMVALLGWSAAALHVPARDLYIGWCPERKRDALHLVANNSRFLVPRWIRKPHLASKVLARNLRRLSADWQKAWGHPVYLAESFVDPGKFRGTTYQASNWRHLGQTAGRRRHRNDFLYDSTPKEIFVYELHRRARQRLSGGVD